MVITIWAQHDTILGDMEPANPSPSKPVMDIAPPKTVPSPPQPQQPATPAAAPVAQTKPATEEHGQHSQALEVHPAPADEQSEATNKAQGAADDVQEHTQPQKSHTSATPKHSHPVREIVILTILVMIILSGLAVLVYLNA